MNNFIVIVGNPVDGFSFYGSFDTESEATDWAGDEYGSMNDWWVAEVIPTTYKE